MRYIVVPSQVRPASEIGPDEDPLFLFWHGGRFRIFHDGSEAKAEAVEMSRADGCPYAVLQLNCVLEACDYREVTP